MYLNKQQDRTERNQASYWRLYKGGQLISLTFKAISRSLPVMEVKETKFFFKLGSFTQYGQHGMYSFYVSVNCGLVDTHIVRLTACCTLAKSSLLVSSFFCTERQSNTGTLLLSYDYD